MSENSRALFPKKTPQRPVIEILRVALLSIFLGVPDKTIVVLRLVTEITGDCDHHCFYFLVFIFSFSPSTDSGLNKILELIPPAQPTYQ